jgi:hypothetical protein
MAQKDQGIPGQGADIHRHAHSDEKEAHQQAFVGINGRLDLEVIAGPGEGDPHEKGPQGHGHAGPVHGPGGGEDGGQSHQKEGLAVVLARQ